MTNYVKGVSDIVKALSKKAKMTADFSANPKSVYSRMHPNEQMIHVDEVLEQMARNPDANINTSGFDEAEFLKILKERVEKDVNMQKKYGTSLLDYSKENPLLHEANYDLERQADDFLREKDPEFFEELNNAMKNYDANTTSMPRDEMIEQISDQLNNSYDNDMSESFRKTIINKTKKDFIKNLYADELSNSIEEKPLIYHLSKDPLENASEIEFLETSLHRRHHNVAMPKGKYYFKGQHKPADYYHNILWNYINKGKNRDALLDEFFKDILHRETPINGPEKFNTIKRYKDALDKRRYKLDMKNKPYNRHKLNNMKAIEEYFNSLRPESFENFESSILSQSDNDVPIYNEIKKYRNDDKNQFLNKTPKEVREKNKQNQLIKEQFSRLLNNLE